MTQKKIIRYSEAFKRRVVDEIASGKFPSISKARRAYGITGATTIVHWIKKYGREDILPKYIKVETMNERDELKEAKKRIRELEAALADVQIDKYLGDSFLEVACSWLDEDVETFKKKHVSKLSNLQKTRRLK